MKKEQATNEKNKSSVGPYIFGGLSFFPLIGVVFGITAIIWGLSIKSRIPVILGASGIALTVILYSSLFYFGFVANYGPYHDMKKDLAKQMLTQTRGQILIYKEKNKKLPTKLTDIGNPSAENAFYAISDPWMRDIEYKVNPDGTFELRSYGPDGIPHNDDDIVSIQ